MTVLDEEKEFDQKQDLINTIKTVKEFTKDSLKVLKDLKSEYKNAKDEYDRLISTNASLAKRKKDELYGEMIGLQKAINRLEHIIDKLYT